MTRSNVNPPADGGRDPESKATSVPQVAADVALLTDPQLVANVAEGSHAALAEIYDRHAPSVHGLAQRLRGPNTADDIVQDVFLRLWRQPHSYDPAQGSLRSFLIMQTHGRSVDLIRSDNARRTRENALADHKSLDTPVDDAALAHMAGEHAWHLLAGLTDGQRSAIVLAYYGGHTYRQVAALLAQPEGTIKSRMRSGLTQLRDQMRTANTDSLPSYNDAP